MWMRRTSGEVGTPSVGIEPGRGDRRSSNHPPARRPRRRARCRPRARPRLAARPSNAWSSGRPGTRTDPVARGPPRRESSSERTLAAPARCERPSVRLLMSARRVRVRDQERRDARDARSPRVVVPPRASHEGRRRHRRDPSARGTDAPAPARRRLAGSEARTASACARTGQQDQLHVVRAAMPRTASPNRAVHVERTLAPAEDHDDASDRRRRARARRAPPSSRRSRSVATARMSARTGLPVSTVRALRGNTQAASANDRATVLAGRAKSPVRQPGDGVLLVQDQRPARSERRKRDRNGHVAAHPDHDVGGSTRGRQARHRRDGGEGAPPLGGPGDRAARASTARIEPASTQATTWPPGCEKPASGVLPSNDRPERARSRGPRGPPCGDCEERRHRDEPRPREGTCRTGGRLPAAARQQDRFARTRRRGRDDRRLSGREPGRSLAAGARCRCTSDVHQDRPPPPARRRARTLRTKGTGGGHR